MSFGRRVTQSASVATRIVLALGVFYLMVAKPRIVESLIVMAVALRFSFCFPRQAVEVDSMGGGGARASVRGGVHGQRPGQVIRGTSTVIAVSRPDRRRAAFSRETEE